MKESNLLASVALFSELYNNEKYNNIADIIAEFIKGAIVTDNRWSINSLELKELLKKIYDFDFPESVIRSSLNTRLKNNYKKNDGYYHFDVSIAEDFKSIDQEYQTIRDIQKTILESLQAYIEELENRILETTDVEEINNNFQRYLLGHTVTDKYSAFISAFVIKNQLNPTFTENLNLIREGVIIYQGIKYTADFGDINELGLWTSQLTIYLSPEHLFNALGYNGVLFSEIFGDFYKLVKEINQDRNNIKIHLKYLPEIWEEVEAFFKTAESIKKGIIPLDPSKTAMKAILEGCKSPADVVNKKVRFELDLRAMSIGVESANYDVVKYSQFNLEDENVLATLKKEVEKQGRFFDETLCRNLFKVFSKINYFRRGVNNVGFDKVGHIFLTANKFALYMAHQQNVKFDSSDHPFAKDIDYITNAFWFKLKKGFGVKDVNPKSFDVITKAQIILSSQLNSRVHDQFGKLVDEFKSGALSKEEALQRTYGLREKPHKPEEITVETIDQSLDFLSHEQNFEDLAREKEISKSLLAKLEEEKEALSIELKRRDEIEEERKQKENELNFKNSLEEYSESEWSKQKKVCKLDLWYASLVLIVTMAPIIAGFLLKNYKPIASRFESLDYIIQISTLAVLTLVSLIEVVGRSYIFDKPRIQNAWLTVGLITNKMKRRNYKQSQFNKYKDDFINVNFKSNQV